MDPALMTPTGAARLWPRRGRLAWAVLEPLVCERLLWSLASQVNREDGQTGRKGQSQPGAGLWAACRPLPWAGLSWAGLG